MGQDTTLVEGSPLAGLRVIIGLGVGLCLLAGCRDEAETRQIRAHTTVHKGVAHAEPALAAERYCAACHGQGLQGGPAGEPSCYQCHGKTWLDEAPSQSAAPVDHTVINKEYRHHPDQFLPGATCSACHGADLQGDVTGGLTQPGCELCHTRLWEERSPAGR